MNRPRKTTQLQIRVSQDEKAAIQRAAQQAGVDMSTYVLSRAISVPATQVRLCLEACVGAASPSYPLADLNSLLSSLSAAELRDAVASPPPAGLTPFLANYVAAMVEYACMLRQVPVPAWTRTIAPLIEPAFGTTLQSLRLHLLTHSPPPFRRRNIYIDSTLGQRA